MSILFREREKTNQDYHDEAEMMMVQRAKERAGHDGDIAILVDLCSSHAMQYLHNLTTRSLIIPALLDSHPP